MGYSVNDEIDAKDYPTEWGTAEEYAEIVCPRYLSSLRLICTSSIFSPSHTYVFG
jgi:hypothetical protein